MEFNCLFHQKYYLCCNMIGQQKRSLEHCISLQPTKCFKQSETYNQKELCELKAEDEVVDVHVVSSLDAAHLKVRLEESSSTLEMCKGTPETEAKDNSSSQEHSSLELCCLLHESSASSPAPIRFFQASWEYQLPLKRVPVGPDHQADVPAWNPFCKVDGVGQSSEDDKIWYGVHLWPPSGEVAHVDEEQIGKGRSECCGCVDSGSIDCVRHHIEVEKEKLLAELGPAYELFGFDSMGECVSEQWTEEEERAFRELVRLNPPSLGRNFWGQLATAFPTRSSNELVSYYFNVFILRRRALQNRIDPDNIDSDDDEGDLPDSEGEDWDHTDEESMEYEDRASIEGYETGEEDIIQFDGENVSRTPRMQDCDEQDVAQHAESESLGKGEMADQVPQACNEWTEDMKTAIRNPFEEDHKSWRDREFPKGELGEIGFMKSNDTELEIMRLSKAFGGHETDSWMGTLEWDKLPSSRGGAMGLLELASTNGAMQEFFGEGGREVGC